MRIKWKCSLNCRRSGQIRPTDERNAQRKSHSTGPPALRQRAANAFHSTKADSGSGRTPSGRCILTGCLQLWHLLRWTGPVVRIQRHRLGFRRFFRFRQRWRGLLTQAGSFRRGTWTHFHSGAGQKVARLQNSAAHPVPSEQPSENFSGKCTLSPSLICKFD